MTKKRKEAQEFILKLISDMLGKGANYTRYTELFKKMTDKEFDDYMKAIRDGKHTLYVELPNMGKEKFDIDKALKAGDSLGINFFKKVWHYNVATDLDFKPDVEYMVLRLPVRPLKQFVQEKMSVPSSDKKINSLTGQVTAEDKTASFTFVENQSLNAKSMEKTSLELLKPRGGDTEAYSEMKRELEETGECSLENLGQNSRPRSVDILKMQYLGMGIKSNF